MKDAVKTQKKLDKKIAKQTKVMKERIKKLVNRGMRKDKKHFAEQTALKKKIDGLSKKLDTLQSGKLPKQQKKEDRKEKKRIKKAEKKSRKIKTTTNINKAGTKTAAKKTAAKKSAKKTPSKSD